MLSETAYRYLLKTYEISQAGICITPKILGNEMNVKRSTAYEFIKKLEAAGCLIKHGHEYPITDTGIKEAKYMLRRHRVIETLLYRTGVDADNACAIATRIQSQIDDITINKIYNYLGNPKCCPHGRPIPGGENEGH